MVPLVTGIRRSSIRASVDLPDPDSPTTASTFPEWKSRLTSSTARTSPPATLKVLVT